MKCSAPGGWRKDPKESRGDILCNCFCISLGCVSAPWSVLLGPPVEERLIISALEGDNILAAWRCEEEAMAYRSVSAGITFRSLQEMSEIICDYRTPFKGCLDPLSFFLPDLHLLYSLCNLIPVLLYLLFLS